MTEELEGSEDGAKRRSQRGRKIVRGGLVGLPLVLVAGFVLQLVEAVMKNALGPAVQYDLASVLIVGIGLPAGLLAVLVGLTEVAIARRSR